MKENKNMNTTEIIKALSSLGVVMTGFQFIERSTIEQRLRNRYINYETSIEGALQMPTFKISLVPGKGVNPNQKFYFKDSEGLKEIVVSSKDLSSLRDLMDEIVKTREIYINPGELWPWQLMKFNSEKNEFSFETLKEKPSAVTT